MVFIRAVGSGKGSKGNLSLGTYDLQYGRVKISGIVEVSADNDLAKEFFGIIKK